MKLYVIDLSVPCSAPAEVAFDVLRDAAGWSKWAAVNNTSLEREGTPAPDGVGAIRRFKTGPFGSREEVVAYEAPTHFAYILHSGIPVRDYRADVTIAPLTSATGCTITWHSTFHRKYPLTGASMRFMLHRFLLATARNLAKEAEARR
ncbi:MAG: SRPBCC family protein [Actinomycetota bacterium]|jgi:hypothetical protein